MNLIVFAMKSEIKKIINNEFLIIEDPLYKIWKHKNNYFVISGVGTINANNCLTYILNKFKIIKKIYNFGIVGCISKKNQIGKVFFIKKTNLFFEKKWFNVKINRYWFNVIFKLNLKKGILLTSDFFIDKNVLDKKYFNKENNFFKNINKNINLFDMEGASYCYVAKKMNKKIFLIKIVSDMVNKKNNDKSYKENLEHCQKKLKKIYNIIIGE